MIFNFFFYIGDDYNDVVHVSSRPLLLRSGRPSSEKSCTDIYAYLESLGTVRS